MKNAFILLTLVFCGCNAPAERTSKVSNKNFQVEILFSDDQGYTVKRFYDGGNYRYYVTPEGSVANFIQTNDTKIEYDIPTSK